MMADFPGKLNGPGEVRSGPSRRTPAEVATMAKPAPVKSWGHQLVTA